MEDLFYTKFFTLNFLKNEERSLLFQGNRVNKWQNKFKPGTFYSKPCYAPTAPCLA